MHGCSGVQGKGTRASLCRREEPTTKGEEAPGKDLDIDTGHSSCDSSSDAPTSLADSSLTCSFQAVDHCCIQPGTEPASLLGGGEQLKLLVFD